MDEKEVKQRIRQAREQKNIPAGELAEQMGVSRRALYSLEKGKTRILNETFERFARITGVPEITLAYGIDPEDLGGSSVQALASQVDSLKDRIAALEATLRDKEQVVAALEGEKKALGESLRSKDQVISMLEKRLEELGG